MTGLFEDSVALKNLVRESASTTIVIKDLNQSQSVVKLNNVNSDPNH